MLDARKITVLAGLTALARQPLGSLSDAQLLERFVTAKDEAAFECLVWRHGPMVYGACQRILHNDSDADDAFQATFLVLFRRAAVIWPRERIGSWLHGVAVRAANKIRTTNARRHTREAKAALEDQTGPLEPAFELTEAIDNELAKLPAKYRIPLVMCELQGQPILEAAQQLGWPQGTVASRLSRGRAILARRLREKWGLGTLLAPIITASQVRAVLKAVRDGAVPANTVAESVVRSLWVTKMTKVLMSVMLVVGTVALVGLAALQIPKSVHADSPNPIVAESNPLVEKKTPPELLGRWRVVREEHGHNGVPPTISALVFGNCTCEFFDTNGESVRLLSTTFSSSKDEAKSINFTPILGVLGAPNRGVYSQHGETLRLKVIVEVDEQPGEMQTKSVIYDMVRDPIAWGPVERGLQLGLSYPPGASRVHRAGERFTLQVHLKNASEQAQEFDLLDQPKPSLFRSIYTPKVVDVIPLAGQPLFLKVRSVAEGEVGMTKRKLQPGQTVRLTEVAVAIEPRSNEAEAMSVEHRFGEYEVYYSGVALDGLKDNEKYSTGKVRLVIAKPDVKLADLPSISKTREYRVEPYIRAALSLQALGKEAGIAKLKELAESDTDGFKTIPLCRMLFTPKAGREFRRPALGTMTFAGSRAFGMNPEPRDWPLAPLEIVEGVPFLLTTNMTLAKSPESAQRYLQYCLDECVWKTTLYAPKTTEELRQALATLLADKRLKGVYEESDQLFLAKQLEVPENVAEQERLQGFWRLVREERNGKKVEQPTVPLIRFSNKQRLAYLSTGNLIGENIQVDPSVSPKRMELRKISLGESPDPIFGIYELAKERLRLRLSTNDISLNPPKHAFPNVFPTVDGQTGVLWEYERETITWGKSEDELVVGLAVSKANAKLGETLTVRLYVQNRSNETVTFEVPNLDEYHNFARPIIRDEEGKRVSMALNPVVGRRDLKWTKHTLTPSAVIEVGTQSWLVREPLGATPREMAILTHPGTYSVQYKGLELRGRGPHDTGLMKLDISRE
jgi:RNA polymerase sigma factor (sigma-70 family)